MPRAAELIFEIWEDPDDGGYEMGAISRAGDILRGKIAPNSVLIHTYTAHSDFEAFQKQYDWYGWGTWRPEPDWPERFFTEFEQYEQEAYLNVRSI